MDMLVIKGARPLRGTVRVSGSKNAALPILAATLALDGVTTLDRVPDLVDVETLSQLLTALGAVIDRQPGGRCVVRVDDESACLADYELVRRMRAGVCVLGPLLAKRGRACVSLPGGCNIGHRPIDLHLKGLRALGATISIDRGYVVAEADRLIGADIDLSGPQGSTVTGTANVLIAACLARGASTIRCAACEPEIVDLGRFLMAAGAKIRGLGTSILHVDGVESLTGVTHRIIPDRIEAATLLIAAAITRGELMVTDLVPQHLAAVIHVLRRIGVRVEAVGSDSLHVMLTGPLRPAEIVAEPFPGIPTDVQAQLTALLALSPGQSVVTDRVFPDRFLHLPELCRMGAQLHRDAGRGLITGVPRLNGACVMASDLRASAALLLAALAAEGDSVIRRIYHLDRGYERLETKLNAVGAAIRRVTDAPDNLPVSLRSISTLSPLTDDNPSSVPPPKFLSTRNADRDITASESTSGR